MNFFFENAKKMIKKQNLNHICWSLQKIIFLNTLLWLLRLDIITHSNNSSCRQFSVFGVIGWIPKIVGSKA